MIKKFSLFPIMLFAFCSFFLLTGCSDTSVAEGEKQKPKVEDKYEKLVKAKNKELELEPLVLTSYSEEIGASLKSPEYTEFAVNGSVTVEGKIEKFSELKSDYAWIKVSADEGGPAGKEHEYYTPIEDGKFKQPIHFFNGEGSYQVMVQLPDTDSENYFYDVASFKVHNVNPEAKRDVTYTPFGYETKMQLDLDSSYVQAEEVFSLSGDAGNLTEKDTVMIRIKKESDSWNHVVAINDGQFHYDVPLFYGEGLHELEVMVPDKEREDYYQTATTLLIDNQSTRIMEPIEYSNMYNERGVTLEEPRYGGGESDGLYTIKGTIDSEAKWGADTTHLYIATKKGEDEALDVIPVEDFKFDDSFYLRFGPGTYEVTVSVPEIKEENSDTFRFFGVAKFNVESTGADKRDLLPSRGVESDAQEIIDLAKEVTAGKEAVRDKTKAIYEYVAKNIAYDVDKFNNDDFNWDDSAVKALELKTGVCQDYAYLAIALLRASDIEARFVEGNAGSDVLSRGMLGGRHAWLEAKVDGQWLTMDPTWGSGYVEDDKFVAAYNEDYFEPNKEKFEETHYRTGISY
ncbi:transglutaminase domain-containing protein [Cytobacillus purgationiresistens]|uniref:Transglutaminase-like domain-containing protein n=1 Tax=Cytobacillus purgationiresistens TaxID=863449 RepID=A0ABU0AR95_9BACI|nr:transglutaminase-like domain-containing protein [Cytobacillus purgationiresistens]MDQ0273307.1 hypothetical protein [Cytobacillus purgationiresistens]